MVLLRQIGSLFWWVFTRIWAPLMALGAPGLALYGAISPYTVDVVAIEAAGGRSPLLIGIAGGGSQCVNAEPCVVKPPNRTYLAFPSAVSLAAVTVVEDGDGGVDVSVMPGGALIFLGTWLVCCFGLWRYWARPWLAALAARAIQ
jgi:hypothetical protein